MNKLSMITAAVVVLTSTSAFAQNKDVFFSQTDQAGGSSVGIGTLIIQQTGTADNRIGTTGTKSLVEGALGTLTIRQLNSTSSVTTNAADIQLFGSDASTAGSVVASFDGSANAYILNLGADGDSTPYLNPNVAVTVVGDANSVTDNLANGASGDTLAYAGTITGNNNTVKTTSLVGVNSVDVLYNIIGASNAVTVAMSNAAGNRDIDLGLTGSRNTWTLNGQSATLSKINLVQGGADGSDVTGLIGQNGINSSLTMSLEKAGAGNFSVTTGATGSNQTATASIKALGGGSFNLNQSTDNAVYVGNITVAAGGTALVNQ